MSSIILIIFLIGLVLFYLIYSLAYTIKFSNNRLITGRVRIFHFLMIWLIPFFWIWLLKLILRPTPGSAEFEVKKEPDEFKENFGPGTWSGGPTDLTHFSQ